MMRLTSSCTETSTRSVSVHVCTTDRFPRKKHKPGRPRPISHTQTPGLPPSTVRHIYHNMTFLPENVRCLMIKITMDMSEIIIALTCVTVFDGTLSFIVGNKIFLCSVYIFLITLLLFSHIHLISDLFVELVTSYYKSFVTGTSPPLCPWKCVTVTR